MVVCWGDSLTAPHVSNTLKGHVKDVLIGDDAYPAVMGEETGDDYEIVNCGVGGENTLTIMARQGAYPMQLAHDVTIYEDENREFPMFIGGHDIPTFVSSYNGKAITPLLQNGNEENGAARINPCYIGGKQYELSSESKFWQDGNGKYVFQSNYFISTPHTDKTYVIHKGEKIVTSAMQNLRGKYAYVFFMGQNGGFSDVADLIRQLKAMIAYSGSKRFIVMSFHRPNKIINTPKRMAEMEDSLSREFGEHYINLRGYLLKQGLKDAGLSATQADRDSITVGAVPPQLLKDGIHFTKNGYRIVGKLVAKKFKQLKY